MEARLFVDTPEYVTPEWYATRERAPHLEQGAHMWRLAEARAMIYRVETLHDPGQHHTVVDLGAGDGGLLSTLPEGITGWGYDLQPSNIEGAKERDVNVTLTNVLTDPVQWADLAVCTEMLEHLEDPHRFVRGISSRWLVASSPVNETIESHYGYHTWCWDRDGYRGLLEQGGFTILEHVDNGQFQVILGERRYDVGGYLPPGFTTVVNGLAESERIQ